MADQIAGTVQGTVGGALGNLQNVLSGLILWLQTWLDKVITPERRAQIAAKLHQFATERPFLAAFLASMMTFSGLPVAIFVGFCVTASIFALIVALLLAVLGAVAFILMAAGFALIFLLPTLFFTTFIAVSVWGWGVGLYYLFKWAGQDEVFEKVDSQFKRLVGKAPEHEQGQQQQQHDEESVESVKNFGQSKQSKNQETGDEKQEKQVKRHPGHKVPAGSRMGNSNSTSQVSDKVIGVSDNTMG